MCQEAEANQLEMLPGYKGSVRHASGLNLMKSHSDSDRERDTENSSASIYSSVELSHASEIM